MVSQFCISENQLVDRSHIGIVTPAHDTNSLSDRPAVFADAQLILHDASAAWQTDTTSGVSDLRHVHEYVSVTPGIIRGDKTESALRIE
jgi:hypothetical protein